ncbi:ImmA/IrrE family metallo-endopeptidase [Pseudonocardia broussonetiae]|uniref:ImmA/IrrE family metallo-endopeptidase n=1 Tax=Pseudonocardia broussonetiae TaxID=2736640 RepID=A0A6M6JEJ2_9PSEU|nr:ImmA/IrrE family metallo-endopeptidase [Pseudonocardia broussonetiae]QJY45523.1 ImmA/IrrE family metallo-endopeptidase [Pseudonocardia broussonetiae]
MTLPRGFKAKAEREAERLRGELGLGAAAALPLDRLAEHLGVTLVSGDELVDRDRLEEIERLQAFAFSAATFIIQGRTFVVTNPLRSPGRLASDVAHEFAHTILNHELAEVREIDGVPFRTCLPDEEEQATAFGGTLLLPRPLLMLAARRGDGPVEIAADCGVTLEMARFRYNTTGVARQAERRSV